MKNNVPIKYIARDFDSIKQEMIEYAKKYYPDNYKDFSEASFGSLMTDLVAYAGDILSFYIDYQANESFLLNSIEKKNVLLNARALGYKGVTSASSTGFAQLYIKIPVDAVSDGPYTACIPILRQGCNIYSGNGISFLLAEDVNFNDDNTLISAGELSDTGELLNYILKKDAKIVSGTLETYSEEIGEYEKFLKVEIDDENLVEVLSVIDSEGNQYYEVDNLAQTTIQEIIPNLDPSTSVLAPYKMITKPLLRKFTVEKNFDRNTFYLQFGSGKKLDIMSGEISDPSSVVINEYGKNYIPDAKVDPSRLLTSDSFGIAPTNTTLTIRYRSNNAKDVNIRAGALIGINGAIFDFINGGTPTIAQKNSVSQSIEVDNEEPIIGDILDPDIDELKIRSLNYFATQQRAVTLNDYQAICYAMPSKFGSIKRVNVVQDPNSFKRNLNLYVISQDQDNNLINSNIIIKNNLKNWLQKYKMLNDTIDILDAKIININLSFGIVSSNMKNKYDVLQRCLEVVQNFFKVKMNIGQTFDLASVYSLLNRVDGVVDTTKVKLEVNNSTGYSQISFNLDEYITPDNKSIIIPQDYILEIKNISTDIKGSVL